jgi:hypothetical protein
MHLLILDFVRFAVNVGRGREEGGGRGGGVE